LAGSGPAYTLFAIFVLSVGLSLVLLPAWAGRRGRHTVFAVTNQRVLEIRDSRLRFIPLSLLPPIEVIGSESRGSLLFGGAGPTDELALGAGVGYFAVRMDLLSLMLYGIPDARGVAQVIHDAAESA